VTVPAEAFPQVPGELEVSDLPRWRQDYRRDRARRSAGVGAVSTVVFLAVVSTAIVSSPGWSRVKAGFFNGSIA
jgi:polar amino acid transport system permease protein